VFIFVNFSFSLFTPPSRRLSRYNETADELAKIASGRTTVPPDVFCQDLHQPSVKIDDTPKPEKASAEPEAPSAQVEVPSARPEAPSAQPEAPSAQSEVPSARSRAPSAQPEAPSVWSEVPSAPEGEALRIAEEQSGVTPNRN
jgi:ribonuclease E